MKFFNFFKTMNKQTVENEQITNEMVEEQPCKVANAKEEFSNSIVMPNKEFGSLLNIVEEYDDLVAEPIGEEPRNPEHDNRHYEISKIVEGEDNFGRPIDKYEVIAKYENNRTDPILTFSDEFKPIIGTLWLTQYILH